MVSASEVTKGALPVKAFEGKITCIRTNENYHVNNTRRETLVEVSPGWYMENFLPPELAAVFGGLPYTPDAEGYMTFSSPRWGGNEEVPLIGIEADYGDLVHGVFLAPEKYKGKRVQGMSQSRAIDRFGEDFEVGMLLIPFS
ncbi:NmrA family protein [Colletotrichum truncatum]|uniref:NmrA family protein n=1 Tax=Colletotrichum truncatum TaxID=5467 RepID=A0ACC3ZFK7_COLTU